MSTTRRLRVVRPPGSLDDLCSAITEPQMPLSTGDLEPVALIVMQGKARETHFLIGGKRVHEQHGCRHPGTR